MNPRCLLTGHFVTPPGLDPWTGLRHDYSPSENFQELWMRWNRSCYGANSASRILNPEGRIRDVVNNYRFLNFSFSPGLLDELARASPNVYRRIRAADADAIQRTGHGNALARPWKEAILPLLTREEAALQIDWGLRAFERHFGRASEGFCLPQDAVNAEVLDLLIERGLKFILLSAHQAEGIMPEGRGSWQALGGNPAPGDRPFRLDRPSGSLAVFFADDALSRQLPALLKDASALERALRVASQPGLVSVAVPAETLGLTEPFADMCLAALWERLEGNAPLECTNYASVLERRPPKELVKLKRGDDELGSSSGCPHGVARWYRECGCRSSATGQHWKTPLWNLLREWRARLVHGLEASLSALGVTPATLRQELPALFGGESPRPWAQRLLGRRHPASEDGLLRSARGWAWLQSVRSAALWSGDDLTSVEGRDGLLVLLRALDFVSEEDRAALLQALDDITLNDGRRLGAYIQSDLLRRRHDPRFAAALFLLDRLLRPRARYQDRIGPLAVADFSRSRHEIEVGVYRYTGHIRLQDEEADRSVDYEYLLLEDHREGVSLYLNDAAEAGKPEVFPLEDLPAGDRLEIVRLMGTDLEASLASETQAIFPLLRKSLVYSRLLDVPGLPMARSLMELAVTRKILQMTEESEVPGAEALETLEEELGFAKDFSLTLDTERLNARFSRWLAQALGDPGTFSTEPVVKSVETLLGALGRWGFHTDLTVAQALVFEELRDHTPALLRGLESGRTESLHELKRLIRLGSLLWIDTSPVKNRVLEM